MAGDNQLTFSRSRVINSRLEINLPGIINHAPVAQLDRATDYESVCRRFESSRARQ